MSPSPFDTTLFIPWVKATMLLDAMKSSACLVLGRRKKERKKRKIKRR
jgi:hypothetical protein